MSSKKNWIRRELEADSFSEILIKYHEDKYFYNFVLSIHLKLHDYVRHPSIFGRKYKTRRPKKQHQVSVK